MKIYGFIFAMIAIFFFSFGALGGRFLTTDEALNPVFVVFLRYLGGVIGLAIFLPFVVKRKEVIELLSSKHNLLKNRNFWISSVFLFLNMVLFVGGTQLSSASNVMLIEALSPIVVGLITLFYFGDKLNYPYKRVFYLLIIATVGSSLLFSDNSFLTGTVGSDKLLGDFFAFLGMIFFAIFSFFYVELRKDYKEVNGLIITVFFLLVGLLLSVPSAFFFYESIFNISKAGFLVIALTSFGTTGIAYLAWFLAGRYLSAILLAMLFNLVGIATIFLEYLVYGKTHNDITFKLLLGAVIVLGAASYANYLDSKKEK